MLNSETPKAWQALKSHIVGATEASKRVTSQTKISLLNLLNSQIAWPVVSFKYFLIHYFDAEFINSILHEFVFANFESILLDLVTSVNANW